jgi:hypothetical protein
MYIYFFVFYLFICVVAAPPIEQADLFGSSITHLGAFAVPQPHQQLNPPVQQSEQSTSNISMN